VSKYSFGVNAVWYGLLKCCWSSFHGAFTFSLSERSFSTPSTCLSLGGPPQIVMTSDWNIFCGKISVIHFVHLIVSCLTRWVCEETYLWQVVCNDVCFCIR
jgi:hypothetical protein